jgi:hypothetical protein
MFPTLLNMEHTNILKPKGDDLDTYARKLDADISDWNKIKKIAKVTKDSRITPNRVVWSTVCVLLIILATVLCSGGESHTWTETDRKPIHDYHSGSGMFASYWSADIKILIMEVNEDGERRAYLVPFRGGNERISLIQADYLLTDGVTRI